MNARSITGGVLLVIAANELFISFEILAWRPVPYPGTFGPLIDGIFSIVIGCLLALIATALLLRWSPKILITFAALLLIIVMMIIALSMLNIVGIGR